MLTSCRFNSAYMSTETFECPHCTRSIPTDASTCPECGGSVSKAAAYFACALVGATSAVVALVWTPALLGVVLSLAIAYHAKQQYSR